MADDQKIVKAEDAAERLYDEASKIALMSRPDDNNNGAPKIFSQHELLALDIAHNTADLMQLCTQLYGLKLVRYITKEGKLCFQLRSRMIASKYAMSCHGHTKTHTRQTAHCQQRGKHDL